MNTVEVPIPPSTNNLWRACRARGAGKTRVYLSSAYAAWLPEAILRIKFGLTKQKLFPVSLYVTIRGGKGWTKTRDLSNVFKAIEDAIVKAGIIPNDNTDYVRGCHMTYEPPMPGQPASCVVGVYPIADRKAA